MKIFKYLIIGLLVTAFATSCEEAEAPYLGPIEDINNGIKNGAWVSFITTNLVIDADDLQNAAYTAELEDQSGQVAEYRVYASWVRGNLASDSVLVATVTSFPSTLSISAQSIADALDSALTDFQPNDRINFYGEIEANDGTITNPIINNVSPDLAVNEGQNPGLVFVAFVACPIAADFTGTYEFTQIQGAADPFFGGETRFYEMNVEINAPNLITRAWNMNFASFNVGFNVLLLCGNVEVPPTNSGVGCGGPGFNWVTDPTLGPGSYDPNDDSVFTVNILENKDGGCGLPPTPETIFEFNKL